MKSKALILAMIPEENVAAVTRFHESDDSKKKEITCRLYSNITHQTKCRFVKLLTGKGSLPIGIVIKPGEPWFIVWGIDNMESCLKFAARDITITIEMVESLFNPFKATLNKEKI